MNVCTYLRRRLSLAVMPAVVLAVMGLLTLGMISGCSQDRDETAVNEQRNPALEQSGRPTEGETGHHSGGAGRTAEADSLNVDYSQVAFTVQDISEREYGALNALAITFSAPLKTDLKFPRYIQVLPSLAEPVLSKDGRRLYYVGLEPGVSYSVEVLAGLRAANDKALGEGAVKTIKAREMTPVVSFESEGVVMVPGHTESLPVMAINAPEADFTLYRVRDPQIVPFFSDYRYGEARYLEEHLEHQYSARLVVGGEKNRRHRTLIDLTKIESVREPGVYFATLSRPGAFDVDAKTWFTVSSIGLQIRKYPEQVRVIAQDIRTGQLLPDVNVAVLNRKSRVSEEGVTDSEGAWSFSPNSFSSSNGGPRLILATRGSETTVLQYQGPGIDLSEFEVGGRPWRQNELFAWSARDIYRPGETMTLSVLKRDDDGQPVAGPVKVEVRKPNGSVHNSWLVSSAAAGYHQLSFDIPSGAPVGQWRARIFSPGNERLATVFSFKVEEFLPERLRLSFEARKEGAVVRPVVGRASVFRGNDLSVKVLGEYLYGAPAAGNRLETSLQVRAWGSPFDLAHVEESTGDPSSLTPLKGYIFGAPEEGRVDYEELGSVELDDKGEVVTRLPDEINLEHWQIPASIHLQYSLYETGGRAINRSYDALLWPRETYVGVKPHFERGRSDKNAMAAFSLLKVNGQGEVQSGGEAKVELYREEEKYFWTYTRSRGWHYQRDENEYLALTRNARFTSDQPVELALPVEWGRYRLEITDLQSSGKTTYRFFAGENWYSNWQYNQNRILPDQVSLALDRKAYHSGDTARVRIAAPTDGTALVMLEANEVLYSTQVALKDRQAEVDLPLPATIKRHDLYVSAFVVAPTESTEKVAKRSFGIIPLPLDRDSRRLEVHIDAPQKWRPDQQVEVNVQINDSKGQPLFYSGEGGEGGEDGEGETGEAWVTLSAVDSGVLSVTGYQVEDPHHYFYSQRQYSARLSDMFDDVLEYKLADSAQQRWGGDADLTRGGEKPRTGVNIASLFSGLVSVEQGRATIPLQLPQFEGELQLTAIGIEGDRFGKENKVVKVASPVVAQLSTPRFLATGDRATLAMDLVNMTGEDQNLQVDIDLSGPIQLVDLVDKEDKKKKGADQQTGEAFVLSAGARKVIYFEAAAGESSGQGVIRANITLNASAGGNDSAESSRDQGAELQKTEFQKARQEVITREWTLGVRDARPALYRSRGAVLSAGESLVFDPGLIAGLVPRTLSGRLKVGKLPDLQAGEHWQYLSEYPYQCLEQTISKTIPYIALAGPPAALSDNLLDNFLGKMELDQQEADKKVQQAMDRFTELQLASGGFGLWSRSSSEEHWLTAYVAEFLLESRRAGYNVPDSLLEPAIKRLKEYVVRRSPLMVNRWSQSPSHYQFAYRAYAAYILAMEGKISLGPLRDMAEKELADALSPLPGVHLGLAMIQVGSQEEGERLIQKALATERKPGMYLGDYGSVIRDQAMVIHYLLKEGSFKKGALKKTALSQLMSLNTHLQQEHYFSPQERSALFQLAVTLESERGADEWQGALVSAGQKEALKHTGELIKAIRRADLTGDLRFENRSEHPLFATFAVTGLPRKPPENINKGIRVKLSHYRVKQGEAQRVDNLEALTAGDIILGRVSVLASKRVPDALLVSLMPAGLELENQNLANALKLENLRIEGEPVHSLADVQYQEFRDDRYVAALDLRKDDEQVLYFIARAVNPGQYTAPPVMVESMYTPAVHGVSNAPGRVRVVSP